MSFKVSFAAAIATMIKKPQREAIEKKV